MKNEIKICTAKNESSFKKFLSSYWFSEPEKIELLSTGEIKNGSKITNAKWRNHRGGFLAYHIQEVSK